MGRAKSTPRISAPSAGARRNNLDRHWRFFCKAALSPCESAPGPSGSLSSGSPATAPMTLPTDDRPHLGRRNALPFGAEPMVRIHLPPAKSPRRVDALNHMGCGHDPRSLGATVGAIADDEARTFRRQCSVGCYCSNKHRCFSDVASLRVVNFVQKAGSAAETGGRDPRRATRGRKGRCRHLLTPPAALAKMRSATSSSGFCSWLRSGASRYSRGRPS
jgi:hypothetical protein